MTINEEGILVCPECLTPLQRIFMESSPETKWYCPTCKAGSA